MPAALRPGLERRLKAALKGEVRADAATRGRYATDASHYQVMPAAVAFPRDAEDVAAAIAIAREEGVAVTPRGGGTSQNGQTINTGLVLDCSRHLNRILELDPANRRAVVQPGLVLDELNRALAPYGLWFPVDVSTASRATLGGMAGNNSCGARSLRFGTMRDNVRAIEAILPDGTAARFDDRASLRNDSPIAPLVSDLRAIAAREADEIEARFPKVQRRVGGYNLDALVPARNPPNLAHLLVGSEGTLAFSTAIELALSPVLPRHRTLGACHFGSFHAAMESAQHIVTLAPVGVELVDRTMIELAREIAIFRPTLEAFLRGEPEALLLVEFAEHDAATNRRRLKDLAALMGDLGFGWDRTGARFGGVMEITDPALQGAINQLRTAGLNIMMSMKEEGKPISFVEDCAVPLEHLADYTTRLTAVFERHGTRGTWYAHAGSGCLHVRPVLNLKLEKDVRAMRAIAEEAFAMVRAYKGSHSGEHGDGIVRSEFHAFMFGDRLVRAFEAVKDRVDPRGVMNPNRIVRPPRMDDRTLFRYHPDYAPSTHAPALDWSEFPRATPAAAFQAAVEMCNNNGACRALAGAVMCPSYRATREERDVTRGRANTLRLALSGQLAGGIASDDVAEALSLCVSCKACRRECPTGVDMARMKIEVLAARTAARGLSLRDRLVAFLPAYAPYAARLRALAHARDAIPGLARLSERIAGLAAARPLPAWARAPWRDDEASLADPDVILFADTFNRWFEPENLRDAARVLRAGGFRLAAAADGGRPLCCGRTYLAAGLVDRARAEARRSLAVLAPHARAGRPIVGLEPSCLLTLRDEWLALGLGETARLVADRALLFEEFVDHNAARITAALAPLAGRRVIVHGHCHSKAFGAFPAVIRALKAIPDLPVAPIESSCCGMAGAFGYQAETLSVSRAMAELSLLPAVRAADPHTLIVANGTSCRHQIADLGGRAALSPARVLASALRQGDAVPRMMS
ncbi:FAD-binding and (Fe-S)-binding domain-containing protein [Elioraea sp.]|uniref:FAD-binding and (Fe-S)-binding domain-containing protein n=1 Tax=Elioraea sp. TaxID=2185103 RepID=UPI00307D8E61